ncbi:glycosyl hydrolase [Halieaceae bacterium IMCC8485]|uniref:Glycosyl hydrolase n=2 Tax=Candidatus Seongchinamella marina TaxID=2518990 RepID=A0ABT3SZR9_9GAMM|nr:glycosyl hydrolase [Candidatus Seongchinamella marina]
MDMKKNMQSLLGKKSELPAKCWQRRIGLALLFIALSACEAPLDLSGAEAEGAKDLRRYDMLQAAAHSGDEVMVVSSVGAIVVSGDSGENWQRFELPGRPPLIDITACPSGEFFALDTERRVWRRDSDAGQWTSSVLDTPESTLSIHCAPNGRLWVSASFGTLYWSAGDMQQWTEFSLYEDLQFTAVRFVDENKGFALGEFGTVLTSTDGGDSWEALEPIPNEFYPMGVDFLDAQTGWAGGLDGVIWQTTDGGLNWERQQSVTSAPIYNVHASEHGVFAVGGSAKLVERVGGKWQAFEGATEVLAFMRGVDTLDNGSLLVAGGGGTLVVIPLAERSKSNEGNKGSNK